MADYTLKRFDEMEGIFGGMLRRARAELGVQSFGMQVLTLSEDAAEHYPYHDHTHDGQEEVYVVLEGSADVDIEGERVHVAPHSALRVGPESKRKIFPSADGVRLLVLGGVPGRPYEPPEFTELGGPEPRPPDS